MPMLELWVAFMVTVAPHEPRPRLEAIARTVVGATADPGEQSLLLTISFFETTWGRRGIPYGVSSFRRERPTPIECANFALRILRRARGMCPTNLAGQLGHYHHGGMCRADTYSTNESRMVLRMRRWATAHGNRP